MGSSEGESEKKRELERARKERERERVAEDENRLQMGIKRVNRVGASTGNLKKREK
jgi:hypothetical protein